MPSPARSTAPARRSSSSSIASMSGSTSSIASSCSVVTGTSSPTAIRRVRARAASRRAAGCRRVGAGRADPFTSARREPESVAPVELAAEQLAIGRRRDAVVRDGFGARAPSSGVDRAHRARTERASPRSRSRWADSSPRSAGRVRAVARARRRASSGPDPLAVARPAHPHRHRLPGARAPVRRHRPCAANSPSGRARSASTHARTARRPPTRCSSACASTASLRRTRSPCQAASSAGSPSACVLVAQPRRRHPRRADLRAGPTHLDRTRDPASRPRRRRHDAALGQPRRRVPRRARRPAPRPRQRRAAHRRRPHDRDPATSVSSTG